MASPRPRIGIVTSVIDGRSGRGTAGVARELLARLLPSEEFDITLIHHEPADNPIYEQYPTLLIPHLPGPFDRQMLREAVFWIRLALAGRGFDVVHYLNPRLWPSYLFTAARRITFMAYEAGIMLDLSQPGLAEHIFRFTNRFLHQRMHCVVASSEFGRDEIARFYRIPRDRTVAIPLAARSDYHPVPVTSTARERLATFGIRQPYLLSVARFDPHKNIIRIIEAFAHIAPDFPELFLVLVGGRHLPEYSARVDAAIATSAHADRIFVAPFIPDEDMPLVYSASVGLVYPSLHEGFGLPIIEAMACGVPVIVGTKTASPETAGGAAALCDSEDSESIAEQMRAITGDVELRTRLIAAGAARAAQFTWEASAARVTALYRTLIGT